MNMKKKAAAACVAVMAAVSLPMGIVPVQPVQADLITDVIGGLQVKSALSKQIKHYDTTKEGQNEIYQAVTQRTGVLDNEYYNPPKAANLNRLPHSLQIETVHIDRAAEWEADNLSFGYITGAGYNPGATAAIWQRVMEKYGDNTSDFVGEIFSPSDHPSHQERRDSYAKKLYEMSGKHASVKDGTVYVNGKKFIKPAATYSMSSAERSYFVLGNLAAAYQNGHSKQPATASGGTLYLGPQNIMTPVNGDPSAEELAAQLNKIK